MQAKLSTQHQKVYQHIFQHPMPHNLHHLTEDQLLASARELFAVA